jgi:hypothetical protein
MRIGIDARAATEERGGRGTLVRELPRRPREDARGRAVRPQALGGRAPVPLDARGRPGWPVALARRCARKQALRRSSSRRARTCPVVPARPACRRPPRPRRPQRGRDAPQVAARRARDDAARDTGATGLVAISQPTATDLIARFPQRGGRWRWHRSPQARSSARPGRPRGPSDRTFSPRGRSNRARTSGGSSRRSLGSSRRFAARTSSSKSSLVERRRRRSMRSDDFASRRESYRRYEVDW